MAEKKVLLAILDGFGLGEDSPFNAIAKAHTPHMDRYLATLPLAQLDASGKAVGLPKGQAGNSEVGHTTMGAGRPILQSLPRINEAIKDDEHFAASSMLEALRQEPTSYLHILGLLSPGGVHSHEEHLFYLIRLLDTLGIKNVCLHVILDGRDVPPRSAQGSLDALETLLKKHPVGTIKSVVGRYFAMDRDQRWDRTEKAFALMAHGTASFSATSAQEALKNAYDRGENDEFVEPTLIGEPAPMQAKDVVFFFNFRADRAKQITRALGVVDAPSWSTPLIEGLRFFGMTSYDDSFNLPALFPKPKVASTLGACLQEAGYGQLRIAETEKYAHVTFFFNGGSNDAFPLEERVLIDSPKVPTYDLAPRMSAEEVTDGIVKALRQGKHHAIIANYANADMVGHTGVFDATCEAVSYLDTCLGILEKEALANDYALFITADHGNAEVMFDTERNQPVTSHTKNPVPFIAINAGPINLKSEGELGDIAPTLLEMLELPIPPLMTGTSLICHDHS